MSVISCKLHGRGSIDIDAQRKRTYTHTWLVETNDPSQGLLSLILEAASLSPGAGVNVLPGHGDTYNINGDTDMGAFFQIVGAKPYTNRDDDKFFWLITGKFSPPPKGQQGPLPENPLEWPVDWSAETTKFTKKAVRDAVDDRLFVNSAGDVFENIEVPDGHEILTAVRNEWPLSSIIQRMQFYKNAIGSHEFLGSPAGAHRMESITHGKIQNINDVKFYPVTYRIEFASEGEDFYIRAVNRGNRAYDKDKSQADAVKGPVFTTEGRDKGQRLDWVYLNYDGTQRIIDPNDPNSQPLEVPDPDTETPWRPTQVRNFNLLGLA